MMTPITAIKVGLGVTLFVVLAALSFATYHYHAKFTTSTKEVLSLTGKLTELKVAKEMSDKAVKQLNEDLSVHQEVVTKTITKLVRIPVSADEKCMSPVLKEALKEEE